MVACCGELHAVGSIPEVPCKYRHGESLIEEFGEVQAVMQFTRALSPGPRLAVACEFRKVEGRNKVTKERLKPQKSVHMLIWR